MVIIVSEYSVRFSHLIPKKNPVATLATLILLSYTTFLRNTITILSFAILDYPDGSSKMVWLPDATVEYLSGEHVVLFIAAILILVVSTAYTCLLFFWQWLLHHQSKTVFKWVRSQRLYHFIEPYHAPYVYKHRYWTGLLLFARVALYLVFALNVSGDPGVNLLAVIVLIVVVLFLKGCYGKIYKTNTVDTIEMACYLNTGILSATQLFLLKEGIEQTVDVSAYISGTITLILLLAVLAYHGFIEFCSKGLNKCKQNETRYNASRSRASDDDLNGSSMVRPTFSVVEGPHYLDNSQHESTVIKHSERGQRSNSITEQSNLLQPTASNSFNRQYGSTLGLNKSS